MSKKIYINASNIHSGGGRVLLVDLMKALNEAPEDIFSKVYVDKRFEVPNDLLCEKQEVIKVEKTIVQRLLVDFTIKKELRPNDLVLHFGNIPPVLNFSKASSFLYLQNRLLIDNRNDKNLKLKLRMRLFFERVLLKTFSNNSSKILIQTQTMLKLAVNFGLPKQRLMVGAFRSSNYEPVRDSFKTNSSSIELKKFVYIASSETYKNHRNLLEAWLLLAQEGLKPKLFLNISEKEAVALVPAVRELSNIEYKEIKSRNDIFSLYKQSDALIYPSFTESFGLPLLEARDEGLDILASEKDYVRDLLSPMETFDPQSPASIVNAVKRYHGIVSFEEVYNPSGFLELLLSFKPPKRVLINGLSARLGGGITYLQKLADKRYTPENVELYFIANEGSLKFFKDLKFSKIIRSPFASYSLVTRLLWENIFLPILLRRLDIDYLICPAGIRPILFMGKTKTVCISQNMLLFDHEQLKRFPMFSRVKFKLIRYLQIFSFNNTNLIIFISNFSKNEIEKKLNGKSGVVIYHGVSNNFRKRDEHLPSPIKEKYFLYVSHFYYYKSHVEVLKTWKRFMANNKVEHKLVLAGFSDTAYGKVVKDYVYKNGLSQSVIFKEEVPQEELPRYYHHADLLIFASVCENCPNILIEGLSSGVPMASSSYGPMPEIAQDAAVYFDPIDDSSLYEIFISFHAQHDKEKFKSLAKKGIERSLELSWKKCMKKTWDSIQSID